MKFSPLYLSLIFFVFPPLTWATATECEMENERPPAVTPLPTIDLKEDVTATELELYQATLETQQKKSESIPLLCHSRVLSLSFPLPRGNLER